MIRRTLAFLVTIMVLPLTVAPAYARPDNFPSVSISLPPDIPSATVQIRYFMVGAFGGYGGYIGNQPDLDSYEINASTRGQAATAIKILVYAAGCDIKTFEFSLSQDSNPHERFVCEPLLKVTLSGELPSELIRDHNAEIVISYMAYWAHAFFGIVDGLVTEFQLAIVSPDKNGRFQVEIPDFRTHTPISSPRAGADLRLMLRDSKTWNHIASHLKPELSEFRSEYGGLKIQSSYPATLKFVADPAS
jgi:hypothetical protein